MVTPAKFQLVKYPRAESNFRAQFSPSTSRVDLEVAVRRPGRTRGESGNAGEEDIWCCDQEIS
jgi:hypothetical protein